MLTSLKITFKTLTPSGLLFYSSEVREPLATAIWTDPSLHYSGCRISFSVSSSFLTISFLFYIQNPFLYLALFHGNLLLVSTNSTNRETIKISQTETTDTETLNDGAYHTVEVTYGPTRSGELCGFNFGFIPIHVLVCQSPLVDGFIWTSSFCTLPCLPAP